MLGLPSDFQQSGVLQMATRGPVFALYAQDSIRLTPHLTINAGLRWEPSWAAYDYFGYGSSFSAAGFAAGAKSSVFPNAPPGLSFYGDPGIPKAYFKNKLALFSPRIGLVWDPTGSGKQTIRVSGAILRDTAELFYAERLTTNAPYGNQIDIPTPPSFTNPYANYPGGSPFPVSYPPPKSFTFAPASVFVNMPLETQPTYTAQWNVSYQRQLRPTGWCPSAISRTRRRTSGSVKISIRRFTFRASPQPETPTRGDCCTCRIRRRGRLREHRAIRSGRQFALQRDAVLGAAPVRAELHAAVQLHVVALHQRRRFRRRARGKLLPGPEQPPRQPGDCNFDVRHLSNTSLVARSPFKGHGMKDRVLGGWQIAPILSIASGIAINVTSGRDNSLVGVNLDRPDLVSSNVYSSDPNPGSFLNVGAFAQNATGTFGNLGQGRDSWSGTGQLRSLADEVISDYGAIPAGGARRGLQCDQPRELQQSDDLPEFREFREDSGRGGSEDSAGEYEDAFLSPAPARAASCSAGPLESCGPASGGGRSSGAPLAARAN